MVTCYGQRHLQPSALREKTAGLDGRKEIWLILIGMNSKIVKGNPRHAGHGICIWRRHLVGLSQNPVIAAVTVLIVYLCVVEVPEIVVELSPHE